LVAVFVAAVRDLVVVFVFLVVSAIRISSIGFAANVRGILFRIQKLPFERE